jgi:hypothetical protein
MAVKDIIGAGIGFSPGSVKYIVTRGLGAQFDTPGRFSWISTDEPLAFLRRTGGRTMTATAPQIRTKTVSEVLDATFGFATKLGDSGAVFTGTPTVTGSPSGLTIGSPVINTSTVTVDGVSHTAGQAIQAEISIGTAGTRYVLTCTGSTDSGETMQLYAVVYVET